MNYFCLSLPLLFSIMQSKCCALKSARTARTTLTPNAAESAFLPTKFWSCTSCLHRSYTRENFAEEDFSRISKDSYWLEYLSNCDSQGAKWSAMNRAMNFVSKNILFSVNIKSSKICSFGIGPFHMASQIKSFSTSKNSDHRTVHDALGPYGRNKKNRIKKFQKMTDYSTNIRSIDLTNRPFHYSIIPKD